MIESRPVRSPVPGFSVGSLQYPACRRLSPESITSISRTGIDCDRTPSRHAAMPASFVLNWNYDGDVRKSNGASEMELLERRVQLGRSPDVDVLAFFEDEPLHRPMEFERIVETISQNRLSTSILSGMQVLAYEICEGRRPATGAPHVSQVRRLRLCQWCGSHWRHRPVPPSQTLTGLSVRNKR